MIRLCTCTRGSASAIGFSKRRAATASCKTCGGKPLVDGIGSPSSSMLGTIGLELPSLINSDLTWKKVSKGNRSSSRRARKSVEKSLKASGELVNKYSKEVEMPVSESEKLGVTVLGCRFSENAEHVPIKKRRFLFRSPSPPPRAPSPHSVETERLVKSQHASGQAFHPNLITKCQTSAFVSPVDLGQIVDGDRNVDGNKLMKVNKQIVDNEDFSGISILAAAACSNSLEDVDYVEEDSGVEFSGQGGPFEALMNNQSKEDLVNSSEISAEGTGSCISSAPPEVAASFRMDNSSAKVPLENISESTSLQVNSVAGSRGLLSKKDEGTIRTQESSARDDRSHWDLNTVMDAWECPRDCQHTSRTNVTDSIPEYAKDGENSDKKGYLEGHVLQKGLGGTYEDIGKALLPGESRILAHETQESNMEEHKLDACTDVDRTITFQAKLLSSETDNAPDVVMDLDKETESLHNEERFSLDAGSLASVPHKHAQGHPTSAIIDENAPAKCINLGTVSGEILSSLLVAGMDSSVDCDPPPVSDHITSTCISEENCDAASTGVDHMKSTDDFAANLRTGRTISYRSHAEKQNVPLPSVAFSDKDACEIGNIIIDVGRDANRISGLHDDAVENMVAMETGDPLGNEPLDDVKVNAVEPLDDVKVNAVFKSNEGGFSKSSHTHLEIFTSVACLAGKPEVVEGKKVEHSEVCLGHDTAETNTQMHNDAGVLPSTMSSGKSMALLGTPFSLSSHEACRSNSDDHVNSSGRVTLEEPLDDGYGSDVSQDDPHHGRGIEKATEFQVDYDSQYEDGELRESSIHTWEEYDGEDGDECLDYGSDKRVTNYLTSENAPESNIKTSPGGSSRTKIADDGSGRGSALKTSTPWLRVQIAEKVDSSGKGSGSGSDEVIRGSENFDRRDNAKESSQSTELKMTMSAWDWLRENRKSASDTVSRVRDGSIRKSFSGDHKDLLEAGDMETKVDGSRVYGRELLSRVEGPASRGVLPRRDRLRVQGSRSERESGTLKSFGSGRYYLHIHARGRRGDHWVDSPEGDRGLKHHRSPTYQGITASDRFGPEDIASDSNITKGGGVGSGAGRQIATASSRVIRRSLRNGSPNDRQDGFGMHLGIRPAGEMSPDRFLTVGRGRSVRYGPRIDGGGPRRRYHGGVNDECIESSLGYSHPLSRRRRSFSPIERRGISHARKSNSKSPSRSGTHSPVAWQSLRGRNGDGVGGNLGFRHRSRSPTIRSDARVPRLRSPHLRHGFAADHVIGFMSVPRSHGSPPPNSRWIGYKRRSSVLDRRSPGRIGLWGDRFDFLDSSRKLNPNEYYRSARPGRFSELNGVERGGHSYAGNDDDRRKHGYRYGLVHPARRYDMDGAVKRFHYDVEDGFASAHDTRDKDGTDFHGRGNPKRYNRGIDSRIGDLPRRSREERGLFIHQRDGKYNANSKSFGMQEGDKDEAPRRRRPS